MMSDQRRSLSGGGGLSSPAFSAADVLRARAMGVALNDAPPLVDVLSPADVLGMRHATDTVLATIRSERAARVAAEKRVTQTEAMLREAVTQEMRWAKACLRWERIALLSVPVVAAQSMVILWMWWRA